MVSRLHLVEAPSAFVNAKGTRQSELSTAWRCTTNNLLTLCRMHAAPTVI